MELYSGKLTVKIPAILKSKTYSNHWCILYSSRGRADPMLELHQNKDQVNKESCQKRILIEDAKWTAVDPSIGLFSFEGKHKQFICLCGSQSELQLWILVLCCASRGLFSSRTILGIGDLDKVDPCFLTEEGKELVVTENVAYLSYTEMSTFVVVADNAEACVREGLSGTYKLRVGQSMVQLLQHNGDEEVTHWTLLMLKKFGYTSHSFYLESGRHSITGPGKFIFHTTEGERIRDLLAAEAKRFLSQQNKTETTEPTAISAPTASHLSQVRKAQAPPPPPVKPKSVIETKNGYSDVDISDNQVSLPSQEQSIKKKFASSFGVPVFAQISQRPVSSDNSADLDGNEDSRHRSISSPNTPVTPSLVSEKSQLSRTISNMSTESRSKKEINKAEKELKREQKKKAEEEKRKAEEEKKERRRKEEEKKKDLRRQAEEEKRLKKEQKKSKNKLGRTLSKSKASISEDVSTGGSVYAEACDFSSPNSEMSPPEPKPQPVLEAASEKIYSEPWGPLSPVPFISDNGEVEYAQPGKRPTEKIISIEPREIIHSENYEPCQIKDLDDAAPPLIPPTWEDVNDSSANVYSHLERDSLVSSRVSLQHHIYDTNRTVYSHLKQDSHLLTQPENVYGLESASNPIGDVVEEDNPYEDTGVSPYEQVG